MEQLVELIKDHAPNMAMYLGYIYAALIASRGLLTWVVTLTKTDKDNKVVTALFDFLDKYGVDFKRFKTVKK